MLTDSYPGKHALPAQLTHMSTEQNNLNRVSFILGRNISLYLWQTCMFLLDLNFLLTCLARFMSLTNTFVNFTFLRYWPAASDCRIPISESGESIF